MIVRITVVAMLTFRVDGGGVGVFTVIGTSPAKAEIVSTHVNAIAVTKRFIRLLL